jgi:hypothetical protein
MKTKTEQKFDRIIKEAFHQTLKPIGFKKKANNFYLPLQDLGQIINIQKSSYGSKDSISFTINTGIFIPEYFLAYYTFETEVPDYPTEPSCALRQRIGKLRGENDKWYEVNEHSDVEELIHEMQENIANYILPYFAKLASRNLVLSSLETLNLQFHTLTKLMLYGELKDFTKAKKEYEEVIKSTSNLRVLNDAKGLAIKYGIVKTS